MNLYLMWFLSAVLGGAQSSGAGSLPLCAHDAGLSDRRGLRRLHALHLLRLQRPAAAARRLSPRECVHASQPPPPRMDAGIKGEGLQLVSVQSVSLSASLEAFCGRTAQRRATTNNLRWGREVRPPQIHLSCGSRGSTTQAWSGSSGLHRSWFWSCHGVKHVTE